MYGKSRKQLKIEPMFYMGSFFTHSLMTWINEKGITMKKFFIIVLVAMVAIMGTGCNKQAWKTKITSGNWTELIDARGEVIYNGPSEYIDDEYELDALTESEFDWIWNHEKGDFDKIERGSCEFNK